MSSVVRPTKSSLNVSSELVDRDDKFRPDTLLIAILLFNWIAVWRIQDIFPILSAIKLPILIQFVTLALLVSDKSPVRRLHWIKSPIFSMLIGILIIMIVGLPVSLWTGKGVEFMTRDLFPTLVLMVAIALSIRDKRELDWFAFTHLLGAALYSFMIFKDFEVESHGRLGSLIYYDSNDLGLLLVCSIPFAVYFMRPGTNNWRKLFSLAAMGLFVLMMIRSGSRGGFIGFMVVMAYIMITYRAIPPRIRIGATVGGVGLLLALGSDSYWDMMSTLLNPQDDYNLTEDSGRTAVWKRGIGYMVTNPILGVGVRAFPQAEGMLSELSKEYAARGQGIKWSVAHNSFVEIGAECGVIALGLFLGILGYAFYVLTSVGSRRGRPTDTSDDAAFSQALIGSLIGFCVCGFFISAEYMTLLYVLLGFVVAQQAVLRRRFAGVRTISGPGKRGPRLVTHSSPKPREPYVHWSPSGS